MRRKRQQNLKKRPRNWFLRGFTSRFISLKRKQVRGCWQRSCGIIQLKWRKNLCQGSRRCTHCQEKRGESIEKKDGKKCIVQNYRYLNEWTVKNNYPLSFILDIIENISTKKVFTKLDLWCGYNNIWIKKEDE